MTCIICSMLFMAPIMVGCAAVFIDPLSLGFNIVDIGRLYIKRAAGDNITFIVSQSIGLNIDFSACQYFTGVSRSYDVLFYGSGITRQAPLGILVIRS